MRPLRQKNFGQLQELFNKNQNDHSVLAALRAELEHRTTAFSKQLLAQVQSKIKSLQGARTTRGGTPVPPTTNGPKGSGNPTGVKVASSPIEEAYTRLRSTFTEQGELMARWGMTPSLPEALQEVLVAAWRAHLKKFSTADGKSATEFEADLERLAALRSSGNRSHDE